MQGSNITNTLLWPVMAVLTLGLAPFHPMPHFFEKIMWLATGHPFAPIDVFDLFMHGAPWAWLAVTLVGLARQRFGSSRSEMVREGNS